MINSRLQFGSVYIAEGIAPGDLAREDVKKNLITAANEADSRKGLAFTGHTPIIFTDAEDVMVATQKDAAIIDFNLYHFSEGQDVFGFVRDLAAMHHLLEKEPPLEPLFKHTAQHDPLLALTKKLSEIIKKRAGVSETSSFWGVWENFCDGIFQRATNRSMPILSLISRQSPRSFPELGDGGVKTR